MGIAVGIAFLGCLRDMGTSSLKDAILDFILPVWSNNNTASPIGLLDLENIVEAVGNSFIYRLQAEIEVNLVLEAAILDLSLPVKCATFSVVSFKRWTRKTFI